MRPPSAVPASSSSSSRSATKPSSTPGPPPATAAADPPSGPEEYETLAQVGEGTYGKVFRARQRRTGTLVALKRVRIEATRDGFPITAVRELQLLQRISSANVVSLLDIALEISATATPMSSSSSPTYVYMVFEYMQHDLAGILHHPSVKFTLAHVKSLVQQLLLGLAFLHTRGIVHRDVKGSNLLLNRSGQLKLADFGLARAIVAHGQSAAHTRAVDLTNRVITLWYRPPELLLGGTHYGGEVDLWSTGCILLELFIARPAFPGTDEIHQLDLVFRTCGTPQASEWADVENLPWWPLVRPAVAKPRRLLEVFEEGVREAFSDVPSDGVLELIDQLLQVTPHRRPTAEQALNHKWFTSELPKPEPPKALLEGLDDGDHWHEFESKQRKRAAARAQQQQQQQQASGLSADPSLPGAPAPEITPAAVPPTSAAPGSPVHVVTSVRMPKIPLAEPTSLASKLASASAVGSSSGGPPRSAAARQTALVNTRRSFVPTGPLISFACMPPTVAPPPPLPVQPPPKPSVQDVVMQETALAQQAVTPSSPGTPAVSLPMGGGGGGSSLSTQGRPTSAATITASVQVKPGGIVVRQLRPATAPSAMGPTISSDPLFNTSPPELALRGGMIRSPPSLHNSSSSSSSLPRAKGARPSPRATSASHAGPSLASVLGFPLPPVSASQANSPVVGLRSPPPPSTASKR